MKCWCLRISFYSTLRFWHSCPRVKVSCRNVGVAHKVTGHHTTDIGLQLRRNALLLCTAHCPDPCLPGFVHDQTFPPRNLGEYTTLGAGRVWRNYLFPSLRFACEGRLETLEITAEQRTSDNDYWDNGLRLFLSVWRPTGIQAYMQVAFRQLYLVSSNRGPQRITNAVSWDFPLVLNFSIDVKENDIVGVALPPSTVQQFNSQTQLISEHIPILMRTSQICLPATVCYQFVSTPLIKANFKPSPGRKHNILLY